MKKTFYYLASFSVLAIVISIFSSSFTSVDSRSLNYNDIKSVNSVESVVKWYGEKVTGFHEGLISIKSADLIFEENDLVGGEIIIDMSTINCTDLSGEFKDLFEKHINSEDFFDVTNYPTSKLIIKNSTKTNSDTFKVEGDLTIKNITNPIEFEATLSENIATSEIVIDRTTFDIKYGSGSFFEDLGDKMINDEFKLSVQVNY